MRKEEGKSKEGMSTSLVSMFKGERSWESWLAFKEDILKMRTFKIQLSDYAIVKVGWLIDYVRDKLLLWAVKLVEYLNTLVWNNYSPSYVILVKVPTLPHCNC